MKTISIHNAKGGVGKTTTCVNLAYNLSTKGFDVLVVDLDPQSNLTPFFTKQNENGKNIKDVFLNFENINKCIRRTKFKNIDIIKGSYYLSEFDAFGNDYIFELAIRKIEKDYDYIIIDCPPSFQNLAKNAINASNLVITPIILDGFCRDNLHLEKTIIEDNDKIPKWKVFANKWSNKKVHKKILNDLLKKNDYPFCENCISERVAISNASDLRKPLLKHSKANDATKDYMDLTNEIVGMKIKGGRK